jgi:hypothetical protein
LGVALAQTLGVHCPSPSMNFFDVDELGVALAKTFGVDLMPL